MGSQKRVMMANKGRVTSNISMTVNADDNDNDADGNHNDDNDADDTDEELFNETCVAVQTSKP